VCADRRRADGCERFLAVNSGAEQQQYQSQTFGYLVD
jgi:hypothetical protein